MTSSSSSGGGQKVEDENNSLSQELEQEEEESLIKAEVRKAYCPPYRGFGIDFSHYNRILLREFDELPANIRQTSIFSKKPLLSIADLRQK